MKKIGQWLPRYGRLKFPEKADFLTKSGQNGKNMFFAIFKT